ncbi:uncharacterized protein EV420DRAFT_1748335 [Desarmillaria tabescens]|uniref:Potassium channel domain-containing protein n=1 Tax=Armillaria tabescens TaxID=1929756 RepID=A0AA39N4N5_ARMTA|nr:uncharacterized protein EV420DRAFT_1748335 [Desarmillaria tabescens]KAK0457996.1 hypothetical protein EV420DRAFT_1748335 [Desarmillaria tabescens]
METVPAFHSISTRVWFGFETSLVALFTVEYVARCIAWSGSWMSLLRWMVSFYGIIDLLSVLPYYIEIILQQDTCCTDTIKGYFIERGTWDTTLETFVNSDGDPTQFASIPAAAWFVIVTISTVGYGEITPRSFLGRLVTLPLLVFGLLLIALPSFVLGREFSIVWEKMTENQRQPIDELDIVDSPTLTRPLFSTSSASSASGSSKKKDLSNRKLAQNQTELSRQIEQLSATVEAQGAMIQRLLQVMDKGKQREQR